MAELIQTERRGSIATVTLNRPEKHNSMTLEMWKQLTNAIETLSFDDTVRCIIIRGGDEKAFSTGYDISEFESKRASKAQGMEFGLVSHTALATLASCPHPLVAQIHGLCVGGGLLIASLCDIRICGESSRFGIPANKLGATLAYPEITPIMRLTGPDVALEILLEGRTFCAQEAKEKRLVSRIVPDKNVAEEAHATAQRIADGAPLAAHWHKKFVRRLADGTPLTTDEYMECFDCFDTEDYRTGYTSFMQKKTPEFFGR